MLVEFFVVHWLCFPLDHIALVHVRVTFWVVDRVAIASSRIFSWQQHREINLCYGSVLHCREKSGTVRGLHTWSVTQLQTFLMTDIALSVPKRDMRQVSPKPCMADDSVPRMYSCSLKCHSEAMEQHVGCTEHRTPEKKSGICVIARVKRYMNQELSSHPPCHNYDSGVSVAPW
ncbi:hypothetical protein E2C01_013080 [Portunus trituberculatus]|uniref:Uncharacterized protein n=1 Tax=Portunus trituberculatus TaxID=210409 RepID=A0A5B7DFQ1_PORTR|nr:hypothetical protein [Portunus trituberculatus]